MKNHSLTILLAALAMIGPFATDTYLPSFNAIAETYAVAPVLVQQTLSAYLFAFALMALFYGTLSDSFGRRPVIIASLLIFIGGSLGTVLAPSFGWLVLFRAVQGMSAGAGMVVGQAIIRDRFQGAVAQRMMANIMMVFGIAPAIAPVVGGYLHVSFGWRSVFMFMTGLGVLLLLACLRALPETLPSAQRHPFRARPIAVAYAKAFRNGTFVMRALAFGFAFGGFALYISAAPDFVLNVLHLPETAFAWLFLPLIGGLVVGSALGGKWAHKIVPAGMIRIGFSIMLGAAAINLVVGYAMTPSVPWSVLPLLLYSFGLALTMPAMSMMTLDLFPKNRGLAASLMNFMQMILFALASGFLAPLLFGSAFKLAIGLTATLLCSLALWTLGARRKA